MSTSMSLEERLKGRSLFGDTSPCIGGAEQRFDEESSPGRPSFVRTEQVVQIYKIIIFLFTFFAGICSCKDLDDMKLQQM